VTQEREPVIERVSFRPPFIPLHTPARWATGLLIATLAMAWIAVGVGLAELRLLLRATGGAQVALETRAAQQTTNEIMLWTQLGLFAATGVTFLAWLFQARANLRALGIRRPSYSRSWVVWSFLVPLVNLFRPYQVIREVWQASNPEGRDAFNWRSLPVPRLLLAWWVFFVGWGSLELMSLLSDLGAGVNLSKLQLSRGLGSLADACAAVSAFLACFVVSRISNAQQEKWENQQRAEAEPTAARSPVDLRAADTPEGGPTRQPLNPPPPNTA